MRFDATYTLVSTVVLRVKRPDCWLFWPSEADDDDRRQLGQEDRATAGVNTTEDNEDRRDA
ncbi:hypothetical protein E2562_039374 [Oryza meyeriana var. granulata]|uniref:Uncharacterized protein n=1 Tax=Oryza meyeriana var. granulata TaxID=110450 RepID=A0A6G1CMD6_9ORYZ|nr:hypothetical protein E2562_039374 [Oryza meyeriana var. granulata]